MNIPIKNGKNIQANVLSMQTFAFAELLPGEHQFMQECIEMSKTHQPMEQEFDPIYTCFQQQLCVFPFLWEESLYFVVPPEIIAVYETVVSDPTIEEKKERSLELLTYTTALCELFGIFHVQMLLTVWNNFHKKKMTIEELIQWLETRNMFLSTFHAHAPHLLSNRMDPSFDHEALLQRRENIIPYAPTRSDIALYSGQSSAPLVGEEQLQNFRDFFTSIDPFLQETLFAQLEGLAQTTEDPKVIRTIAESYWHPFSEEEAKRFELFFRDLRNHMHVWALNGHTYSSFCNTQGYEPKQFSFSTES